MMMMMMWRGGGILVSEMVKERILHHRIGSVKKDGRLLKSRLWMGQGFILLLLFYYILIAHRECLGQVFICVAFGVAGYR